MDDTLNEEKDIVEGGGIISEDFLDDDTLPVEDEIPVGIVTDEEEEDYLNTFDDHDDNY